MISITLPDGSVRSYDNPVSGTDIAGDIGAGLLKASIAMTVDGVPKDLSFVIENDANISIITRQSDEALDIIRHDCAHVLAEAVQELFPNTQITFGPSVDDGFYYDFYNTETMISINDFEKIEAKMNEIIKRGDAFTREVWSRDEAHKHFSQKGETFKAEHVLTLPEGEDISIYKQGDWLDLCRGIHSPTTASIGNGFKLMKVAGAYWRGDANNPQLQRVYGTAWRDKKELKAYLERLEQAEARDHRKLGREMDLFHLQEEAQGSVFWHEKGWALYRECEEYIRRRLNKADYIEVKTPQLVDRTLWEKSGHWEKFREAMFTTNDDADDEKVLAIKPMNCPCHVEIFKKGQISYKSLPLRMAEFGCCHRNEPSGALHGIMRVRGFTQDDAHIFCTEEQVTSETKKFCDLLKSIYEDFGFTDVKVKFSDRPEVRAGSDETWDKAETALKQATESAGLEWTLNPGEGAFYGPKLEFVLTDAIGRDWQCGTLQADFVLPERLDASYIGEDNAPHRPVMLHRAILGSMERFIGILIENYSGKFPLWLAPTQVAISTITDGSIDYAKTVAEKLKSVGIRTELDIRSEKINYKVREHSLKKTPVQFVVGNREAEENTVAIRRLGTDKQEVLDLDMAISNLVKEATAPDLV